MTTRDETSRPRGMGKIPAAGARPLTPTAIAVREALGFAHYERMRVGMRPALTLPGWDDLEPRTREAYRRRTDYLLPAVLPLCSPWRVGAHDPEGRHDGPICDATLGPWGCTRRPHDEPPHAASDGVHIIAVWDEAPL